MRSFWHSRFQGKGIKPRLLIAIAAFAFALALVPDSPVYADAAGGTGGAGNGSGGAHSTNGWGWYNYSVNGNPQPAAFRWSGNWSSVSTLCSSQGADRVIAFIVLRPADDYPTRHNPSTDASKGVVYDYWTVYDSPSRYSEYNGDAGGNWLETSTAKALFDKTNVDKSVYIWGVNVAWFCYNSNPIKYSLTPSITNNSGAVEPGSEITISPSVENAGPTSSKDTSWRLNSFRVSPGNTIPSGGNSGSEPCSFYTGTGVSNCGAASFTSGGDSSGTFSFPKGTHNYTPRTVSAPDLPAGSKICYALSVQPRAQDSAQWSHSTPSCIVIGSKPKVQVWGADLYVGRVFAGLTGTVPVSNIQTSSSTRNVSGATRTWGSWGEYGAQASGTIRGFGTGASFAAGSGLVGATTCSTSPLTFTNGTNGACANNGTFGNYVANQTIPAVADSFPTTGATNLGNSPTTALSSLNGTYTATGTVRINASTIGKGRTVILNAPTATVLISGNISYNNGTLNSISDIPQVLIIARNINIEADVDNVDAWLIARGTNTTTNGVINTCSNVAATANLALSPCNNQLVVNGPVMANKLYLRRTTDSSSSAPAEIFNLRPDAFLWAYARSTSSARVQTVYTTELPPRL